MHNKINFVFLISFILFFQIFFITPIASPREVECNFACCSDSDCGGSTTCDAVKCVSHTCVSTIQNNGYVCGATTFTYCGTYGYGPSYCSGNSKCTYPQYMVTYNPVCENGVCTAPPNVCGTPTCADCGSNSVNCVNYCNGNYYCSYSTSQVTCQNGCSNGACGTSCSPSCPSSSCSCVSGQCGASGSGCTSIPPPGACTACANSITISSYIGSYYSGQSGPISKTCSLSSCSGSCTTSCPGCTIGSTYCSGTSNYQCQAVSYTALAQSLYGSTVCSQAATGAQCNSYVNVGCSVGCGAACNQGQTQPCNYCSGNMYCVGGSQSCSSSCAWGSCTGGSCSVQPGQCGATTSIQLSASPSSVGINKNSTITANTSDLKSGISISFTTDLGSVNPTSCTTNSSGQCPVNFTSSTSGTATITGSATSYTSGTIQVAISSTLCGNGVVDPGENCRTCPADAGCTYGQLCQPDGTCAPPPSLCGNGVVDPGETCITCPADAGCTKGAACQSDGTCKTTPPNTNCNSNGICEPGESCDCIDCANKGDGCLTGDVCDSTSKLCKCNTVSDNVCTNDPACKAVDPDCTLPVCNSNGICDPYESCNCADCSGKQDGCISGDICNGYTTQCGCTQGIDGICPLSDLTCALQDPDCTANLTSIYLAGGANTLNIYWNGTAMTSPATVNLQCFLNCDPENSACGPGLCTQNVSSSAGACTIPSPSYFYDSPNLVKCRFSDPPTNHTFGYVNTSFKPYDVDVKVSSFSVTVGQRFVLPVTVKNTGLFIDNYTVDMSENNLVGIDAPNQSTGFLTGGSSQGTNFNLIVRAIPESPGYIGLTINVNSTTNVTHGKVVFVQLKAGTSSLPEFGFVGVLQIIFFSTLAFAFILSRKK